MATRDRQGRNQAGIPAEAPGGDRPPEKPGWLSNMEVGMARRRQMRGSDADRRAAKRAVMAELQELNRRKQENTDGAA